GREGEQGPPQKQRPTPIPATAGGRRSDAGASSTSRPLAKAAATQAPPCNGQALAPARIPTRKGEASPAPTAIPATSMRISGRRGSTTTSGTRRSNTATRDPRFSPLVGPALRRGPAGTVMDGRA